MSGSLVAETKPDENSKQGLQKATQVVTHSQYTTMCYIPAYSIRSQIKTNLYQHAVYAGLCILALAL